MDIEVFSSRDLNSEPITVGEFQDCADFISTYLPSTPQISWPLLSNRLDCNIFVKHENHLPTGSFKVRGGIWSVGRLASKSVSTGVIAATRGNHGQSVAHAARTFGIEATIVVPFGNNPDKNHAMKAMGAKLLEFGKDFDSALDYARHLSGKEGLRFIPSFHPVLVQGVGTYAYEFLQAVPLLETVYIPIGLGSGIAGFLSAKEALGAKVEVVGVVSENADAYASSWEKQKLISTTTANTIADGLAVRVPSEASLNYISNRVSRIIRVSDQQIIDAIKIILSDTHNLVEPAGAASLAGLIKENKRNVGKRVGVVFSGSNIESETLLKFIKEEEDYS